MNVKEIRSLTSNGKIFSVEFVKKDGSLRKMKARLGVRNHLRGGVLAYDAESKNLLPVFDMDKSEYRMINVSTITKIKISGNVITFDNFQK